MAQGEVCNLESLGLPLMSFDIPDGIFCESFPVEHRGIEKSDLVNSLIFQPWCGSRVEIVSPFIEPIYLFSVAIP